MKKIIIGEVILNVSESDYVKLVRVCIFDKTDKQAINTLLDEITIKYEKDSVRADIFHYID